MRIKAILDSFSKSLRLVFERCISIAKELISRLTKGNWERWLLIAAAVAQILELVFSVLALAHR